MDFKEMTIPKPRVSTLPTLELNGKWLEEIGFTVGEPVRAIFDNSCLTLTIDNKGYDLQVQSRIIRNKPRTTLTLNAYHLKKYGFNMGDRVGLTLNPNQIQMVKINRFMVAET